MKVRHVLAALLLAASAGPLAYAEEPQKVEAQSEAQSEAQQETQAKEKHKTRKEKREARQKEQQEAQQKEQQETPPQAQPLSSTEENKNDGANQSKAGQQNDPVTQHDATGSAPSSANPPPTHALSAESAANPPIKAEQAPAPKADEAASWLDQFLYEVKVTDVLLALLAGALVLIGWVQARRLRETVAATKETALAAGKSARVAEDALISGQRAFMFIKEFKTFLHLDPVTNTYRWTIHPIWENSGNTPTKGLSINTTYRILSEPLPKDYDFPHAREDLIPTIAGPKTMVEAVPGSISSEDLAAVQTGAKYFYVWGWAEYHDIFEGTQKHITRFCNQLTHVIGDTAAPISEHNVVQMMFGFHTENNYAD